MSLFQSKGELLRLAVKSTITKLGKEQGTKVGRLLSLGEGNQLWIDEGSKWKDQVRRERGGRDKGGITWRGPKLRSQLSGTMET